MVIQTSNQFFIIGFWIMKLFETEYDNNKQSKTNFKLIIAK